MSQHQKFVRYETIPSKIWARYLCEDEEHVIEDRLTVIGEGQVEVVDPQQGSYFLSSEEFNQRFRPLTPVRA